MQTKEQIKQKVLSEIADEANIAINLIEEAYVLADPPLSMNHQGLGMLTLDLRKYVKAHRPDNTVLMKEVRKSGLTVKALIDLITEKFN
ncbi:hypothetical protein [Pedobacter sp. MW01-1-1]|uniref:hypothetical protein n=1 Tax=Pedobacter sp. MW01-1-1 TaxID=3383027 RepID=UPI003FF05D43